MTPGSRSAQRLREERAQRPNKSKKFDALEQDALVCLSCSFFPLFSSTCLTCSWDVPEERLKYVIARGSRGSLKRLPFPSSRSARSACQSQSHIKREIIIQGRARTCQFCKIRVEHSLCCGWEIRELLKGCYPRGEKTRQVELLQPPHLLWTEFLSHGLCFMGIRLIKSDDAMIRTDNLPGIDGTGWVYSDWHQVLLVSGVILAFIKRLFVC